MKLKNLIENLEMMKEKYESLQLLIQDQVKDNEIDEADKNFKELLEIRKAIEQMENTDFAIKE